MEFVTDKIKLHPESSTSDIMLSKAKHSGSLLSSESNVTSVAPNDGCPLLQLPGELRNRIYELIFDSQEKKETHYMPTKFLPTTLTTENRLVLETHSLKQVCHQLRKETLDLHPRIVTNSSGLRWGLRLDHHSVYSARTNTCLSNVGKLVIEPHRTVKDVLPAYGFTLSELRYLFGTFNQHRHIKVLVVLPRSGLRDNVRGMLQSGAVIQQAIRTKALIPGASQRFRKNVAKMSAALRQLERRPEGFVRNVLVRYSGESDEKLLREGWYPWCEKHDKTWVEMVRRWYEKGI